MKRFILMMIVLLGALGVESGYAQGRLSVKISLKDTLSSEPVGFATVSLTQEGALSPAAYTLAAEDGQAILERIKAGKYTLKVDLMGYKSIERQLNITKSIDLGTLYMSEDALALEAARVTAVGNPITIKPDTIEYNATAFKVSDNAKLRDLLEKLPGVEIDDNGTVTANGEAINKITLNGKTFFLDDPALATENIPAKMVEKVKVIDKKSEQSIFSGVEDGETEKVIDVSTYSGMKAKGWFGNIEVGAGYDLKNQGSDASFGANNSVRYSGNAMVGRMSEDYRLFILANANNVNRGNFGRRGSGMSFGGRNNGISNTWMTGANFGYSKVKNLDVSASVNYGGYHNDALTKTDKMTTVLTRQSQADADTSYIYNNANSSAVTHSESIEVGAEVKYTPEKTRIYFMPRFQFSNGWYNKSNEDRSANDMAYSDMLNSSQSSSYGINNKNTATGYLMIGQRIGRPGRTITFTFNYNISQNGIDAKEFSNTHYFANDSTHLIDQYARTDTKSLGLGGGVTYTEPIYKNLYISANYRFNYNGSSSIKNAYDYMGSHNWESNVNDKDDYLANPRNEYYSSEIEQKFMRHQAGLSFQYQKEKNYVQIGANVQPTYNENITLKYGQMTHTGKDEWLFNWAPEVRANYQFNETSGLRAFYNGRSSQPSATNLQPMLDISNPTSLTIGNVNLRPSFAHNANIRFMHNNKQTFSSLNVNLGATFTQNGTVSASWFDSNGIKYTIPVNSLKPSASINANVMINTPIAKSKFSIMSFTRASVGFSTSYQNVENRAGVSATGFDYAKFMDEFWGDATGSRFYSGESGFAESQTNTYNVTERINFRYNGDQISANIGARARFNAATYSLDSKANMITWNNSVDAGITWKSKFGFEIDTDASYNYYIGYSDGYNQPEFIWDAKVSQKIGKFTIVASVKDILAQGRNVNRTMTENYVQDKMTNRLGRYGLLSLVYNFGTFGGPGGQGRGGMRGGRF